MALVSCRECGREVSDGAGACPHCGISAPGGQSRLELRRAIGRLAGSAAPMRVWIDGNEAGVLTGGKSNIDLSLLPGTHRIECQVQANVPTKTGVLELDVPAGRRLIVTISTSKWNGAYAFASETA